MRDQHWWKEGEVAKSGAGRGHTAMLVPQSFSQRSRELLSFSRVLECPALGGYGSNYVPVLLVTGCMLLWDPCNFR